VVVAKTRKGARYVVYEPDRLLERIPARAVRRLQAG